MTESDGIVVTAAAEGFLPRPALPALDLELTERCDNDCRHCCANLPLDDAEARGREMSTERVKEIIDEAVDLGLLRLRITGGEPLVRDDFEEIYLHARHRGVAVGLCTNARRVTRRLADLFARVPPLSPAEVTVYGMTAQTYETMTCRRGSFDEFRRGLGLLVEAGVPLRLNGAFRPPFEAEMRALVEWAESLPTVTDTPVWVAFYDLRRRRDSERRNETIEKLRAVPDEVLAAGAAVAGHEAVSPDFCRRFCGPTGDRVFSCDIGGRPAVDPYGYVHGCSQLRDPSAAYDLSAGSLKQALTDHFPRLAATRASDPAYLERCARCFLAGICDQCPARSYAEYGVFDRPVEYQCEVTRAKARRLGLLAPGEHPWEVTDWKERIECLTE